MTYRFAYFGLPHVGGTYTVFRSLRAGLERHGIVVRWLGVAQEGQVWDEQLLGEDAHRGRAFVQGDATESDLARRLIDHIADEFDGVFVTVLGSRLMMNLTRYLPERVRRVLIVHTPSIGTLRAAGALRASAHAAVAVSHRTYRDLIVHHRFPRDTTWEIPNAIDLSRFLAVPRDERAAPEVRILSLGRIEEAAKGVFWLPRIFERLDPSRARLTIAGDGPDRRELERRMGQFGDRVTFLGFVPDPAVPRLYAEHDIFLMPSRMEGFGQTLVEAMAAGCVPVASRITGVTDTIVRDGEDGSLFAMGDVRAAASAMERFAADRSKLAAFSAAARRNVSGRFELERQGAAYAEVVERVMAQPRAVAPPLPVAQWSYPRATRPGLRTYLPDPIKNALRVWRERYSS